MQRTAMAFPQHRANDVEFIRVWNATINKWNVYVNSRYDDYRRCAILRSQFRSMAVPKQEEAEGEPSAEEGRDLAPSPEDPNSPGDLLSAEEPSSSDAYSSSPSGVSSNDSTSRKREREDDSDDVIPMKRSKTLSDTKSSASLEQASREVQPSSNDVSTEEQRESMTEQPGTSRDINDDWLFNIESPLPDLFDDLFDVAESFDEARETFPSRSSRDESATPALLLPSHYVTASDTDRSASTDDDCQVLLEKIDAFLDELAEVSLTPIP